MYQGTANSKAEITTIRLKHITVDDGFEVISVFGDVRLSAKASAQGLTVSLTNGLFYNRKNKNKNGAGHLARSPHRGGHDYQT